MIMHTIVKALMPALMAASALGIIGTSASAALTRTGATMERTATDSQRLDTSQLVHKAVWSEQDQRRFWEQQQDRGG
jgi:hypothetical protein